MQADFLPSEPPGKPKSMNGNINIKFKARSIRKEDEDGMIKGTMAENARCLGPFLVTLASKSHFNLSQPCVPIQTDYLPSSFTIKDGQYIVSRGQWVGPGSYSFLSFFFFFLFLTGIRMLWLKLQELSCNEDLEINTTY